MLGEEGKSAGVEYGLGVWSARLERARRAEPTRLLRLLLFSGNRGGNPGSLLSVRFVEFPPVISESS